MMDAMSEVVLNINALHKLNGRNSSVETMYSPGKVVILGSH